jgi:hypothetical protein
MSGISVWATHLRTTYDAVIKIGIKLLSFYMSKTKNENGFSQLT